MEDFISREFGVEYELEKLTTPQLNKLKETLRKDMSYKKVILMIIFAPTIPVLLLGIYNKYNNIAIILNIMIFSLIITLVIRYFFDNKVLENIFIIIFGALYCFLLYNAGYKFGLVILVLIILLYYAGSKLLKKRSFIAWIDKYVIRDEKGRARLGLPTTMAMVIFLMWIGSDVKNVILIFLSFFLSMAGISNVFNTYYDIEINNELKKRHEYNEFQHDNQ